MTYDSITNRADYLSAHYLAEILPKAIKEKGGLRARWTDREKDGQPTPVTELRRIRREYFDARLTLASPGDETRCGKLIAELNRSLLRALGYPADSQRLTVNRADEPFEIPVAYAGQNVVAIDCCWATDPDAAFDAEAGGRLLEPVTVENREVIETGSKLARWLFAADEPPRYVLLLHGGVTVLADRLTWGEGRYLAVSLDTAIERGDRDELETVAALFSADALQPPAEGGEEQLAKFVAGSVKHTVGVSKELREGLRESVQIIANEVLDRLRNQDAVPEEWIDPKALTRQSLRYLYRILFLLYAEVRPELGILPVDDEDYVAGYSMARLGELVAKRLGGEEAQSSFHLYESLEVLFRMVNNGHRARGTAAVADDDASEAEGLRFEALRADLFLPPSRGKRLIGTVQSPNDDDIEWDTRLRDGALYRVLRRLMLTNPKKQRSGGRGKIERGGFISYAQLGINQLGAVYEGLMSYTGFIASEELYEVAKKHTQKAEGDPTNGSWMIPTSKVADYPDNVFVMEYDESDFRTGERVRYHAGSFVYRLAGRDRQTSASYYTPQSLTSVTVQLALEQRVKEQGGTATAAEVLRWRVCEPALGSGAFLNEAIDQLAALYLRLREEETGDKLEPEDRALALQKVKAYIALHNCYGVDLNETAVELAEVSIWLNVMHRGLQAPWFGLHLVRGNSLIGCGRRLYPVSSLAKGEWLDSAPVDHPFSEGDLLEGHIHHFLLPAKGWGAVAGEKEARQLAPDDTKLLAAWRKQLRKAPSAKKTRGHKLSQVERLQALSVRAEYLWSLVIDRLQISEREISRQIDVWGAENLPHAEETIPRDKIVKDLTAPGTPYWRLKTLMDTWCAFWFWPVDKVSLLDGSASAYQADADVSATQAPSEPAPRDPDPAFPQMWEMDSLFGDLPKQLTLQSSSKKPRPKPAAVDRTKPVALTSMDDWLDFAEALLGRQDVAKDSLASTFTSLSEMEEYEDKLESEFYMNMDSPFTLPNRFPWLDQVKTIADAQGFFHWELRFASIFSAGGFDLQVGNPPWVKSEWDESGVLAEVDPWFKLSADPDSIPSRRQEALRRGSGLFLDELTSHAGLSTYLGSRVNYPALAGTQPDLYRCFMVLAWKNVGPCGTSGLIHYDTHFGGVKEGRLRAATYKHLRFHAHFQNRRLIFSDIDWNKQFSINIYGRPQIIEFTHVSWLFAPETLIPSIGHGGSGESPGLKYDGAWDLRPHRKRLMGVTEETLLEWRELSGDAHVPADQVKLLYPVGIDEQRAIERLAMASYRVGALQPQISAGFHEAGAQSSGLIRKETWAPNEWSEVILRGPQLNVATPLAKQPPNTLHTDKPIDLTVLDVATVPTSSFRRAAGLETYQHAQECWFGSDRRYTEFYRVAWREMVPASTERSLFPALIPPGPAHIHAVRSMALPTNRQTALVAGFWATIPLDYVLRVGGHGHLDVADARAMPAPDMEHPLSEALLLRTLRLNCVTTAYASLWRELYQDKWLQDEWAVKWIGLKDLARIDPEWIRDTPLRTERERRSALVEMDTIAAVMLGIGADELIAIYKSRFPQLVDYEREMWFDARGRKLAANFNQWGWGQTKEHWTHFQAHLEFPSTTPPPDGYTPPFYKADRIAEYRQAHAAFERIVRKSER